MLDKHSGGVGGEDGGVEWVSGKIGGVSGRECQHTLTFLLLAGPETHGHLSETQT